MPDARWIAGLRIAGRFLVSVAAVVAITLVFAFLVPVNPATVGFLYLIATLLIAATWGLAEAAVASIIATVCFNFFFFPPLHTFVIEKAENWVALFAFLFASLLASQLSGRARRRTAEAVVRQRELEQVHAVTRAILLTEGVERVAEQLAAEIIRAYGIATVAIYEGASGRTFVAGADAFTAELESQLRNAAANGGTFRDHRAQIVVSAFGLGAQPAGSLALAGTEVSARALESLSNLVAIGLEKARHQEATSRAEAARQMQEFKSLLLDALAHEFKTPLTTITAAASAVTTPGLADFAQQQEFVAVIEQEAERLAMLVGDAIQLSRIEAGSIQLEKQACGVRGLVDAAVAQMAATRGGRAIELAIPDTIPDVHVDRQLMQLVLRQLIDNALKYSSPQTPVTVGAEESAQFVSISVGNQGQEIPQWEVGRLFEKFYRGTTALKTSGTGMGLAIVSDIVAAHGGRVHVESQPGCGTEVIVAIPLEREGAGT